MVMAPEMAPPDSPDGMLEALGVPPSPDTFPDEPAADASEAAPEDRFASMEARITEALERAQRAEQALTERQSQEQQAQQAQQTQAYQAEMARMAEVYQQAAVGLPEEQRTVLDDMYQHAPVGKLMANPAVQQQLQAWKSGYEEYQDFKSAMELVGQHFGHQTSMTRAQELAQELMSIPPGPARQKYAERLAGTVREQNRIQRGTSGAERVEGPGNGGYTPASLSYTERLRRGGPMPSPAEIDRDIAAWIARHSRR